MSFALTDCRTFIGRRTINRQKWGLICKYLRGLRSEWLWKAALPDSASWCNCRWPEAMYGTRLGIGSSQNVS